jgi:hypothetical protein
MKRISIFVLFIMPFIHCSSQKVEISVSGIAGITLIDVESALDAQLEDWSTFSYGGYLLGMYRLNNTFLVGIDAGYHRLYYWEEIYQASGYGNYYRWGDAATIHAGPIVELRKNHAYLQAGGNLRIFTDESGTVPAIMAVAGYDIELSENISIPIGLRTDVVFGSGVPISIDLSIGFKYCL